MPWALSLNNAVPKQLALPCTRNDGGIIPGSREGAGMNIGGFYRVYVVRADNGWDKLAGVCGCSGTPLHRRGNVIRSGDRRTNWWHEHFLDLFNHPPPSQPGPSSKLWALSWNKCTLVQHAFSTTEENVNDIKCLNNKTSRRRRFSAKRRCSIYRGISFIDTSVKTVSALLLKSFQVQRDQRTHLIQLTVSPWGV